MVTSPESPPDLNSFLDDTINNKRKSDTAINIEDTKTVSSLPSEYDGSSTWADFRTIQNYAENEANYCIEETIRVSLLYTVKKEVSCTVLL